MDIRSTENRPRGPWWPRPRQATLLCRHAAARHASPLGGCGSYAQAAWRQHRVRYTALHRAPKKMMAAPIRQTALPITSEARGTVRSTMASQTSELTM